MALAILYTVIADVADSIWDNLEDDDFTNIEGFTIGEEHDIVEK